MEALVDARPLADGQVAELDTLIRREFYPIVDELAEAAREHLKVRQASTLQEANMVYLGLVELLKEQSRARLERTRALITGGDVPLSPEVQRTRDARAAELKGQIAKMDLLVQRLEGIEQAWAEKSDSRPTCAGRIPLPLRGEARGGGTPDLNFARAHRCNAAVAALAPYAAAAIPGKKPQPVAIPGNRPTPATLQSRAG